MVTIPTNQPIKLWQNEHNLAAKGNLKQIRDKGKATKLTSRQADEQAVLQSNS